MLKKKLNVGAVSMWLR